MKRKNIRYLLVVAIIVGIAGFLKFNSKANEAGVLNLPDFNTVQDGTMAADVPINTLKDFNQALTSIVDEAVPSVVTIKVSKQVKVQPNPMQRFFNGPFGRRQKPQKRVRKGLGSGVIVSKDGYILTNNHVVAGAENITVILYNERQYQGKVIGRDPLTDIAVVKIDAENLNPIPIGNSDKLKVGEMVLAVGSPLGIEHSVSFGIVSAKGRTIGLSYYENYIQTDAAINPGNSGGALINMSGQLIGINTAIASRTGGYQGIGFAVPSNLAKSIMKSIIDDGKVERGYLGIALGGTVDATMARALGIDLNHGVIVGKVTDNSPAAEGGLQEDDIIYAINGNPINKWKALARIVGTSNPGKELTFSIIRDHERMEVAVTLGNRANSPIALKTTSGNNSGKLNKTLGFDVDNLTGRLAQRLGLQSNQAGVIVTKVNPTSDAHRQGLKRGDIIIEVANQPVENVSEFVDTIQSIEDENQVVLLKIIRVAGNTTTQRYIAFEL